MSEQEPLCRCPQGQCFLHPSLTTCGMRERRPLTDVELRLVEVKAHEATAQTLADWSDMIEQFCRDLNAASRQTQAWPSLVGNRLARTRGYRFLPIGRRFHPPRITPIVDTGSSRSSFQNKEQTQHEQVDLSAS